MQYDENMRVASRTRERRERVAPNTAEKKTNHGTRVWKLLSS